MSHESVTCALKSNHIANSRLRNSLYAATKRRPARFADLLAGKHFLQRFAQVVRVDSFDLLRIVDATVIDQFSASIKHISFRRAGRSETVRYFVAIVLENRKSQSLLGGM